MTLTVEATYEDGVLRPERALPLQEREKVAITVHRPSPGRRPPSAAPTTEERQAALGRLLALQLPASDWEETEDEIGQDKWTA